MDQQQQVEELLSAWYSAAFTILDVRHVCLKPREQLQNYRLPANSFLFAYRGSALVELDGQPFITKSFRLLHGVKGSTLDVAAAEDLFVYYLILYKAALTLPEQKEKKSVTSGSVFGQTFGFEPGDPLSLLAKAELLGKQWHESDLLARIQTKATFFAFVTEALKQLQEQNVPLTGGDLAGKVLRYMHVHYAEPINLEHLAGLLAFSQRHLTRLFKQQTGFSPIDYLVRYRMEKAKGLLTSTDASLQQIAASVGYPDVYFFSRMFKKITGQSPIKYKEEEMLRPNNPLGKSRYPIAARRRGGHTGNDDNNHYQRMGGYQMRKGTKHATALILLLSLTLLMSACGGVNNSNTGSGNAAAANNTAQQEQATERVLTDGLGHEVKVPANPQRVLASYLEDHLVTLGVMPVAQWSVGEGSVQQYLQEKLKDIPAIPSELPFETVMSFDPDLIIIDNAEMVEGDKYDKYSAIAPTFTVGNGKNNDWRQELLTVGDILNKRAEAEKALAAYEQKAKDAKEKLQQAIGTKSAAALWVTAKSIYVVNQKLSSGDVLYNDLGFTVPAVVQEISASSEANWSTLSMEKLAELDADYLFIVNAKGVSKEELLKDPIWASVPAVKAGQVYEFDKSGSWLYTGAIANGQMIDDVLENAVK
ncbi:iron complex transport system substrate-binding protein [Paenibacillus catalpae]|uniref:Iron complex transport system substrate-binding protein n=1 Tax=Paenibacillus catalpae TaxID=1045775 RepID=A0A1I1UZ78_9BACL|nr:AraC family transcriptional regulator [Paenibacillus catalpae]SFD75875.1 iron complex transport system substrate-binding protein [Paenibacillus catalpae]